MKKAVLCIIFFCAFCLGLSAQTTGDSIVASLLTCSPGTKAYSLYGHTAVRVRDLARNRDLVFNYGVFDFRRPNFSWHFVLGECDYEVVGYPFALFMKEYGERGSWVMEQRLNLSSEESKRLLALLVINCQPENKIYRYNFLLNNCTTKARDIIESAIDGKVVYQEAGQKKTYRELLHEMTHDYPWTEAGNDLLLGAACDTVTSDRAAQFLPGQLKEYMSGAQVFDEQNNRHPLLAGEELLLEAREIPELKPKGFFTTQWGSPLAMSLYVLGLSLLIVLLEYLMHRMFWGFDILLMTVQGVAGCLLLFMFLFSQHPTVDSNWQLWPFNPLPLFCIPWVVRSAIKRKRCLYHYLNALFLVLFIVFMPWIPQTFSVLTLPLALVLLTRPCSYLISYGRKEKREGRREKREGRREKREGRH